MSSFVVYADMVADLFHAGHVRFLEKVRALAQRRADGRDVRLVVGVHTDEDVESYKRRPVMPLDERVALVAACRHVDEVVPAAPMPVTEELLRAHAIDLVVHGDDMDDGELAYWYAVPMRLGIFETVPYSDDVTTSGIIERVLDRFVPEADRQ